MNPFSLRNRNHLFIMKYFVCGLLCLCGCIVLLSSICTCCPLPRGSFSSTILCTMPCRLLNFDSSILLLFISSILLLFITGKRFSCVMISNLLTFFWTSHASDFIEANPFCNLLRIFKVLAIIHSFLLAYSALSFAEGWRKITNAGLMWFSLFRIC